MMHAGRCWHVLSHVKLAIRESNIINMNLLEEHYAHVRANSAHQITC